MLENHGVEDQFETYLNGQLTSIFHRTSPLPINDTRLPHFQTRSYACWKQI